MTDPKPPEPPKDPEGPSGSTPSVASSEDATSQGFGYSTRRVWLEIGAVAGVIAVGVFLVIWIAGKAAEHLTPWVPPKLDVALGRAAWPAMAAAASQCRSPEPRTYVEALAATLTPHLDSGFEFQFRVVDDDAVNAFALPGGFITVNMGLLKEALSGEEVAAVIAHEMVHVSERHGTRRILRQLGGLAVLSLIFGGSDFEQAAGLVSSLASGAYDRGQESEADEKGRRALMAAGISPLGMGQFFDRLKEQSDGVTPPEFLSSHPDPGRRAERARASAEGFTPTRTLPLPSGLTCNSQ